MWLRKTSATEAGVRQAASRRQSRSHADSHVGTDPSSPSFVCAHMDHCSFLHRIITAPCKLSCLLRISFRVQGTTITRLGRPDPLRNRSHLSHSTPQAHHRLFCSLSLVQHCVTPHRPRKHPEHDNFGVHTIVGRFRSFVRVHALVVIIIAGVV